MIDGKRVAVIFGSRKGRIPEHLEQRLYYLLKLFNIDVVIDGAATGVDGDAHRLAKKWGFRTKRFPADWDLYHKPGRKNPAGRIRNREMAGVADLGISFPGGSGTKNMLEQLEPAGVTTVIFREADTDG
ncbi:MAG: DUF2493 domain-containing protein [bacterium]|nr:DUF2493 domain-containing protein [bacterium]